MIKKILVRIFQKLRLANSRLLRVVTRKPQLRENASAHAAKLVKGKELPSNCHVVRYVKPSMIREDGSVVAMEFCLRPNRPDEKAFRSIGWRHLVEAKKCNYPKLDDCIGSRSGGQAVSRRSMWENCS